VIEAAEAMADESQNALLRTLEEPPAFAHLLLLSAEPEGLKSTVTSRCQWVRFSALTPEAIEKLLKEGKGLRPASLRAAARLANGDAERAHFLLSGHGASLREAVVRWAEAIGRGEVAGAPWGEILDLAEAEGAEAAAAAERAMVARGEEAGGAAAKRAARDAPQAGRRAGRRRRTEVLDLALGLLGAWFRDLAAAAEGAPELALNADRAEELGATAEGVDPRRARRAAELTLEARRRLRVNVSEELALEALSFRAEFLLRSAR